MLPQGDGLEVCRILRGQPATATLPIVMLTAKAAEVDRVLGLEFGADDYVTKPFSPRELVARVRAVLRRADGDRGRARRRQVYRARPPAHRFRQPRGLARRQAARAQLARVRAAEVLRAQSQPRLRPPDHPRSGVGQRHLRRAAHRRRARAPPAHAGRARRANPELIQTVRGVGYRFNDQALEALSAGAARAPASRAPAARCAGCGDSRADSGRSGWCRCGGCRGGDRRPATGRSVAALRGWRRPTTEDRRRCRGCRRRGGASATLQAAVLRAIAHQDASSLAAARAEQRRLRGRPRRHGRGRAGDRCRRHRAAQQPARRGAARAAAAAHDAGRPLIELNRHPDLHELVRWVVSGRRARSRLGAGDRVSTARRQTSCR